MSQPEDEIEFPDVFADTLSAEEVASYFADLGQAAEVHELRVKNAAQAYSSDGVHDLERCARDWSDETLYSLQVIYTFDEQTWCDTLQRTTEGTRVVRLKSMR